MTNNPATCWKCSADISSLARPLGRQSTCPHCSSWLRCCLMCQFYQENAPNQCREPIAEPVKDKTAANFCDYFRQTNAANRSNNIDEDQAARQQLKKLFGDDS